MLYRTLAQLALLYTLQYRESFILYVCSFLLEEQNANCVICPFKNITRTILD